MVIRMVCFALTVLITPYGWYTWVFAIATAVLPYIAVVFANAISPAATPGAESPTQQLTAPPSTTHTPPDAAEPTIITLQERPKDPET